ncbi:MAG TPA: SpvB/TcaC N-terminal domain-containing protein, partial [Kofleriaceae bacterium]|nr:SpvB/TcaC N-terminal domain-containing protein [Kofleriaceae bacterium]
MKSFTIRPSSQRAAADQAKRQPTRATSHSLAFDICVVGKRLTAVALAAIGIMGNFAHAAPADIVTSAAPAMGADAPKGSAISGAEASVATQTGSLQYAYPIAMPPGRNGMVPSLALTYSSQGSIYGGIAAGWSLDVPIIKKDTSKSALATSGMADQDLVAAGGDARDNDMFVSGLAGGRPLVRVTEAGDSGTFRTYRAQNDNSGARYERMTPSAAFRWRVRTNDGTTHYFGTPAQFDGCNVSDDYAPLTSSRDAFGNEIVYSYVGTSYGECLLSTIEYGRNGTISHHATVSLTWDSELVCTPTVGTMANGTTPVGSQLDYRDGSRRMFGTKALAKIEVQVVGTARTHYRAITLSYLTPGAVSSGVALTSGGVGATCSAAFAPYRQLVAIDEEATSNGDPSTKVNLPRVTFSYGSADIARTTPRAALQPPAGTSTEYSAGLRFRDSLQRWPRVDRMMLDLDGDGRPDQLESESVGNECKVKWWRNTTTGWQAKSSITLPRLPWSGTTGNKTGNDSCALNAQLTFVDNGGTEGGCTGTRDKTGSYLPYRWIDMDGDSLPDLVTAIHYDGDQFDPNIGTFPLPQAPTCGVLPPPSTCIAVREIDIGSDGGETCGALGCTINYSTFKTVEVAGLTKSPYCPRQNGQLARQCIAGQSGAGSTCGRDLLGSCASDPTLVVVDGMAAGTQSGCSFQEPINPDPPMHCGKATKPYGKCGGYPWWIYKNLGNGQLAATASVKIQPQPLESDGADSTLVGNVSSLGHGMVDIDGDGLVDLLAIASSDASTHPKLAQSANPTQTQTIQAQPGYWQVFPNNGAGQFVTERPGLHAHLFRTPRNAEISRSSYETAGGAELSQTALLTDLNGDGLPDYLAVNSTWLNAEYVVSPLKGGFNNGLGISEAAVGAPSVSGIPSIGRAHISATSFEPPVFVSGQLVSPGWLIAGDRELWSRLLDTDSDGRQDLIIRDTAWTSPFVSHFNLGGVFSNLGFGVSNAVRNKVTTSSVSTNEVSSWQTRSDLVDLDGDGISEAIDYDVSGGIVKSYDPAGHPPRLLYQISNGRGATTTVTYGAVSNVVAQDTANGYRMPHAMWVVTNLSTTDVFAGTTTSSGTTYADPAFTQDPPTTNPADHGKWNFRGFRKVTTTSPTGAQTIQKYQYGGVGESLSPDWSGRLVETQVIPAEAPTNVRSISRTAYEGRTSFAGAITTYHPVEERKYTCANGQDVTTCLATPAGFSRTASTLTAFPSAVAPEMWTATTSTQQGAAALGNPAFVDGDRQTVGTFTYVSNSTTYRFRQTASESSIKVSGALVPFARSETDWDTALNLPMKQRTFFSTGAADYGETRYEYNALGQVTKRYKPMQSAVGSTVYAENVYDAPYSLFVEHEINELGHQVDKDYDYGTGAVIATRGPNVRTCVSNCTGPLKEEHLTKVDGIGRPMEERVTLSDDGYQYSTAKITEYKYFDVPTFGGTPVPASMTTYKIIEATFTAWTGATAATGTVATVRSDYDGSGRLTRTVQLANGAAAANAVTSYLYGNDGKLISVSTPDPTLNTSAQVTTTYSFDSIGRPTGMRLPDNAVAANRSGVDMAYNGRTSTTTEVVGAAGKPAPVSPDLPTPVASTVSTVDDFGRLITVTERRAETGPGQWATTQYTYSPRNEMATITEPQGIVTTLVHDFAGRRTSINRDG